MSVLFIALLIQGFLTTIFTIAAFYGLSRYGRRRHRVRIVGSIAILLAAWLLFLGMHLVTLEHILNEGPDDLGAVKFARDSVEK